MASSDIERFNFYPQYKWQPDDFDDFQTWIDDTIDALMEGAFGAACLSGLNVTPNGGMQVAIAAGIAVNASGRLVVVPSQETANLVADGSNPRRSLVVLRPTVTDADDIPEPVNPPNMVPLHEVRGYSVVVISGTPAGTPAYPSIVAGDIIVMGIKIAAGQTVLAQADMDHGKRDVRRKSQERVRLITGADSFDPDTDSILECNGTFAVTMPSASLMGGKKFTIVNVGSGVITVNFADACSGVTSMTLDDQYQTLHGYGNGNTYRQIQ